MDSFWDILVRLMDQLGGLVVLLLLPIGGAIARAIRKHQEEQRQRPPRRRTPGAAPPRPLPAPRQALRTPPRPPPPAALPAAPPPHAQPLPWLEERGNLETGWALTLEPPSSSEGVSLEQEVRAVSLEEEPRAVSLETSRQIRSVGDAIPQQSDWQAIEREYGARMGFLDALSQQMASDGYQFKASLADAERPAFAAAAARWRPQGGWREALIAQAVLGRSRAFAPDELHAFQV